MLTIFNFSSESGEVSTKKSDSIIVKITEAIIRKKLTTKEKEKYIDHYVVLVRKSAHFFIYFILGLLLISFIKEYKITNIKSIVIAVTIVFLYACSDEIHQIFVIERSGELKDVLLDTIGGFISIMIYTFINKKGRRKNEQEKAIS